MPEFNLTANLIFILWAAIGAVILFVGFDGASHAYKRIVAARIVDRESKAGLDKLMTRNAELRTTLNKTIASLKSKCQPDERIGIDGKFWNPTSAEPPIDQGDNIHGLTSSEFQIHYFLTSAFNHFARLPQQHPSEEQEFGRAIIILKGVLAVRVARRSYPKGWPTYELMEQTESDQPPESEKM